MATLNINGQRVNVDDSFLQLSPEQQEATVNEIAGTLGDSAQTEAVNNPATASELSTWDKINDVVSSAGSGLMRGAADLVGIPGSIGDAFNGAIGYGTRKGYELITGNEPEKGSFFGGSAIPSSVVSGNAIRGYTSAATGGASDYEPKTTTGKYVATASEFIPSAAAFGGFNPASLARNAIAPAVASEGAGQLTEGTALEPYARIIGAIGGGVAANSIGRGGKVALPSARDIKDSAGYGALKTEMQNAGIPSSQHQSIVKQLNDAAADFGIVPNQHQGFKTLLTQQAKLAEKNGATLQDLEILRRALNNAGSNIMDKSSMALSRRLIDTLDDAVEAIPGGSTALATGVSVDETLAALKNARQTWRTGVKAEKIETAVEAAQNAASGFENGLRVEFRKLINNPRNSKMFNEVERQAIKEVVQGKPSTNAMRWLGGFGVPIDNGRNFLGSMIGGGTGAAIGSAVAGPLGAAIGGPALMGVGTLAKMGANASTRNSAKLVEALVKAGPDASRLFGHAVSASKTASRESLVRALTQSKTASQVPFFREREKSAR